MPTIATYDPPFLDVDTTNRGNDNTRNAPIKSPWFGELYTHSNFSFLGVFLTHTPIVRRQGEVLYPDTAGHISSEWTHSLEALRQQSWGAGTTVFVDCEGGELTDNLILYDQTLC